jgi:hypothetical protein
VTPQEQIRSRLSELLTGGTLPLSGCSSALLRVLRPALDAGVVAEEKSGAGRRLVVRNFEALRLFFAGRYPNAGVFDDAPSRVVGLARFRDSKVFANDAAEIVCIRAWKNGTLLRNGPLIDVVRATREHGVFAFSLTNKCSYSLRGFCALIENPVVFALVERLSLPIEVAILGRGRISTRLLDWLAQMNSEKFKLIHLPDYDPIGLNEFARLRAQLGERVTLHLPSDLGDQFARFSKRSLLEGVNSQSTLRYLRRSQDRQIRIVLQLIDKHNAGLEQESLLLDLNAGY